MSVAEYRVSAINTNRPEQSSRAVAVVAAVTEPAEPTEPVAVPVPVAAEVGADEIKGDEAADLAAAGTAEMAAIGATPCREI